jgi:ELP3 family radical SAM enzyme/protein acetyltransferase
MSARNPQEIRKDDLDSASKGILNIFENINSEVKVAKLKRMIMRDEYWSNRIASVRKKINNKVDADGQMPNNPELLKLYAQLADEGIAQNSDGTFLNNENKSREVEQILKRLKVRSNSGVAVVSLLTKPYTCPGRCIYCPTEKNMPKSYLSREPAAARALLNRFDPYKQITMRLRALTMNGHPVDKIEMIMIGGTFNFYKKDYQEFFTKEAFRACNNWKAKEENREEILENHNYSLEELQIINEKAHARIIGLSIETRPDYITPSELKWLRYLGVTKVELGVQHLNNSVLEFNKREMTAESIARGTEMLRDYGFKVVYHMMPNLPTSTPEMDVQMFKELYSGKSHHPDMMKIYPCMVLRGSLLYKWVTQRKIEYKAYDDELLTQVLADAESFVPSYTRLIRVIRDIPADYIIIGSKKSNLREDVDKFQKARGVPQVDIRAREIRDDQVDPNDFELTETWYETEHGYECFLQFESDKNNIGENKLAGFLRLRLPKFDIIKKDFANINRELKNKFVSNCNGVCGGNCVCKNQIEIIDKEIKSENTEEKITANNWGLDKWYKESEEYAKTHLNKIDETLEGSAFVRELHVYGTMKRVGEEGNQSQHTGMGKRLLKRAEEIASGDNQYYKNNLINKYKKLSIISGVGVREYYRKRGYCLEGTYMVKELK